MPRRLRTHDRRAVADLGGVWDFVLLGDVDPDAVDVGALAYDDRMAVPGCFDATPAYAGRRGLAAYRTWISVADAVPHRLVFEAVQHWCRVIVGGQPLRDHAGGFTRFAVDLPAGPAGRVELVVLVDNRLDQPRSPLHLSYFDWYHYGGIARDVALHRLGALWIDDLRVVTDDIAAPAISVTITYAAVAPPGRSALLVTCDGRAVLAEELDLAAAAGQITRRIALEGAALWSPDAPNLHMLHVQLGTDDWRVRVGLRQVAVAGRQLLINGRPARLLGFNRHESHPQHGHSQPDQLLVSDIQQLRDLGCSFVRGSHYPNDPRFLDLCDEAGICVWSEAIGWQHTAEHLTDRGFVAAQRAHIAEMVAAAANHPSVVLWGLLNEGHSHDPRSRPAYAELLGLLRALDPGRPVTYASNHPFDDGCLDLADVVAINTYPGWYVGELAELPALLDQLVGHLDGGAAADKPLIISEIGAGAIPGWRDGHGERWTEQYQAALLELVIRHLFIERSRVCGLAIWLYNDFRTPASVMRPRGINDKGVVDEYRRPKAAYAAVRRLFAALRRAGDSGPVDVA